MSKAKKIILTIVIIIVSLAILAWIFIPRLLILFAAKQVTPDVGPAAEYFTEYDKTIINVDYTQNISHDGLTITLPGNFVEHELTLENTIMYILPAEGEEAAQESIVFMAVSDLSDMNLFSEENMAELTGGMLDKFATNRLMKGFEALGHGFPDSAYNTLKSTALLSEDDYSFWNVNQGFAYVISGMIKNTSFMADHNYIYENEDICGIIHVRELPEDECKYYIVADMFSTDDLGSAHGLLIKTNHLDLAYAMINSIIIE